MYVYTLRGIMRSLALTGKWVMAVDPLLPPGETGKITELT